MIIIHNSSTFKRIVDFVIHRINLKYGFICVSMPGSLLGGGGAIAGLETGTIVIRDRKFIHLVCFV